MRQVVVLLAAFTGTICLPAGASIVLTATWSAYNLEPHINPIGASRGIAVIDPPRADWQLFAPQYTFTRGDVQPKLFTLQAHSSASPIGVFARNYSRADVSVQDQFAFYSIRPDLENAAGTVRVTLFCSGSFSCFQDPAAPTDVSTFAQWQASAALGPRLATLNGTVQSDGSVTGQNPSQEFSADIPFVFDADEETFIFHASAYARSTAAADATATSVANVDFTVVWGGIQVLGPNGEQLQIGRDLDFHSNGLAFDTTEAGWDWTAALPDPSGAGTVAAACFISILPRRCRSCR